MPAATHCRTYSWYQGSLAGEPQELLMMFGRLDGSGSEPSSFVGASIHCALSPSATSVHTWSVSQPFAEIQRAPGATPIWRPLWSSPTMVPIVWLPCPALSHGASVAQTLTGSYQL